MIDDIKAAVHAAAGSKRKSAMFHLQILMHADELRGVDPVAFCEELAVPVTYATEFRKMLGLARLMKEQGIRLT
ncbi:MAG TPA: hypothetical protein DC054_03390 [Blastocatellia bacterium]|nr:hypothetical protein [Blastocatellia bacterium]